MKLGVGEIIIILIVLVMIFGAGKIPEMGKQIGRGIRDFKKFSSTEGESTEPKSGAPETAAKQAESIPPKDTKTS